MTFRRVFQQPARERSLHPILIKFGSFHVPTYGVLLVLGILAAMYSVTRLGRQQGFEPGRLFDLSTWLIVVGLLGAKVLMILTEWSYYRDNPGEILSWATLQSGGVFYGGFIAAVVFDIWYLRVYRLPFWRTTDVLAPAVALGQSVGRLGCFAAGCDYGKPTSSFLGVVFSNPLSHQVTGVPLNIPIHPAQLYESLATLAIFGILLWRFQRKAFDGEIFFIYIGLYAVARFFIEFLRGDEDRGFVFNHLLSTSQFIAILGMIATAFLACHHRFRHRESATAVPPLTDPAAKRARN